MKSKLLNLSLSLTLGVTAALHGHPVHAQSLLDDTVDLGAVSGSDNKAGTIKLPTLPDPRPTVVEPIKEEPKKPVTPPAAATAISATPTKPGQMAAVTTSFPGISCSLVDNRPHQEILAAINKLQAAVRPPEECKDNADLARAQQDAQSLAASVGALQSYWENPDLLAQSNQITNFQGHMETVIRGIERLGSNISSNALLDSQCGQKLTSAGDVFVAFTDLISAFAPFALIGASMNPSLKVALPYILGITGAGSAAKIGNKILKEQSIEIGRPEVRNAVLQNVCEYIKISEKVRFLKLAQSGQLETVTRELQTRGQDRLKHLYSAQGARVRLLMNVRDQAAGNLDVVQKELTRDERTMSGVLAQLKDSPPASYVCNLTKTVLARAGSETEFPGRAIGNFRRTLGLQTQTSMEQTILLESEQSLRQDFAAQAGLGMNAATCAEMGNSYLTAISKILIQNRELIRELRSSLNQELSKNDPAFRQFLSNETAAKAEVETAKKISQIMTMLSQENAVIDKVEMHSQMLSLKRALFSPSESMRSSWVNFFATIEPFGLVNEVGSPAFEWLRFIETQQAQMMNVFKTEFDQLQHEAYMSTPAGRGDFYRRDANGQILRDKFGHAVRLGQYEINQRFIDDMKSSQQLTALTAIKMPQGSTVQKRACQRLENVWLAWAAAMDHLAAQEFFCSQISNLFDADTDRKLIQRCEGMIRITGEQMRPSDLAAQRTRIAQKGQRDQALLINQRMKDLSCEMPNPLQAMYGIQ